MLALFPDTKALLPFTGRFVVVFLLTLPLWFVLTPAYSHLLASSVNIFLRFTEVPHVTTLIGWKGNLLIVRSDVPFPEGMKLQGFSAYLAHTNLVLLVALVFAQRQVDGWRRCKMLAVALSFLLLVHVLYLVIGVNCFQQPELEVFQSLAGRISVWGVNVYLSMASQLLPVLIWMALYRVMRGSSKEERQDAYGASTSSHAGLVMAPAQSTLG